VALAAEYRELGGDDGFRRAHSRNEQWQRLALIYQ
jgi:hypothetical protein